MRVRPLDFARYEADLAIIMDIFNDAWSDNWGFVPMSQAELRPMAKALNPIVRPQSVVIAELDGRPVAMAMGLPNVNEAIAALAGRLPTFGWDKLLWRLTLPPPNTERMPVLGVCTAPHGTEERW